MVTAYGEPMKAVIVPSEFASSDLCRNHLCHSNFASCEGITPAEEGRKATLA